MKLEYISPEITILTSEAQQILANSGGASEAHAGGPRGEDNKESTPGVSGTGSGTGFIMGTKESWGEWD